MSKRTMLTTEDNPFSPFDQFDEWLAYDTTKGYHSSSLLARTAYVSNELSEADYDVAVEQAIDEILKENLSGVHIKVTRQFDDTDSKL